MLNDPDLHNFGEEVRAAGRTTGKKAFAAGRTTGKNALPHHRQEGFCRTTGKELFTVPQARRFLPHHRQEGFCRTSGEMVTTGKQYSCCSRLEYFFFSQVAKCEDQR